MTAEWTDDKQQAIKAKTTTFVDHVENANYRIAYILVEDGMKGTTPEWYQSNYYAGSSLNDPYLVNLTKGEPKITNVAYNYIPVAAYEPFCGIEGSLPTTIVKDEAMEHEYTIDISANTRIQDKMKLSVIALLLDKDTGKIINAAKFKFDKGSDSGNGGFIFFEDKGAGPGDANGDGVVDGADIVEMVNYITGKPSDKFKKENADVNSDEQVNVADIVRVASMIHK